MSHASSLSAHGRSSAALAAARHGARALATLRRCGAGVRPWGWPACVGLVLVAAGLLLSLWAVPALQQAQARAEAQLRQARAAARAARQGPAVVAQRSPSRAQFMAVFPPADQRQHRLGNLWVLARAQGLAVRRSEFRAVSDAAMGVARYRITMPLEGSYPALRQFIEQALRQDPALSLDRLRLDRPDAGSPVLRAELQLSLWSRTAGADR